MWRDTVAPLSSAARRRCRSSSRCSCRSVLQATKDLGHQPHRQAVVFSCGCSCKSVQQTKNLTGSAAGASSGVPSERLTLASVSRLQMHMMQQNRKL